MVGSYRKGQNLFWRRGQGVKPSTVQPVDNGKGDNLKIDASAKEMEKDVFGNPIENPYIWSS